MSLVDWNPELSVGSERLDHEHRHLISLFNQLHTALAEQRETLVLGSILKELVWHTRHHFRAEELLMKQHAYDGLAAHIAEHDRFSEQVAQYVAHFQSGRTEIAIEVADGLREWLIQHISQYDLAYARLLQSSNLAEIGSLSQQEMCPPHAKISPGPTA